MAQEHDTDGENPETESEKTESHDQAVPEAWSAFMRQGWGERELDLPLHPAAPWAAKRRDELATQFRGQRLVIPAGTFKVRSNDCDYRFRAETAHVHLSGNQSSDAVLVIEPDGEAILFARPRSNRDTDEFFRDRAYGELWAGRRPSSRELSDSLGLRVRNVAELEAHLDGSTPTRTLHGESDADQELTRAVGELRLVKDDWEIEQLQEAVDATVLGFQDCFDDWTNVLRYGERWVEGTFGRRARTMGNDVGYDSIVASGSHATVLHWTDNTGPVRPGELILLDMGVEGRNLYTADVTRTLPTSGSFTPLQRDLYSLVLRAQDAGIAAVAPGQPFQAAHQAAIEVLAHGLADLDLLPVSVAEALDPESKVYSRWTLHSVSHMLGMDVHDCAGASTDLYPKGNLQAGMVLTVEPGLYFQEDDLLVPEELRGIGIRIEDDVLVTADGRRNLSEMLPRSVEALERALPR